MLSNWKLGLMIFGMLAALGFHVWADYLTTPIQGKVWAEGTKLVHIFFKNTVNKRYIIFLSPRFIRVFPIYG